MVTAQARSAATVPDPRRRRRRHVYHGGVQESLLKGSAVVALVGSCPSSKMPSHRPLPPIWGLRERQALEIVVLVHGFILRKASCSGKAAAVKLGPFKSSVMLLCRVGGGSTVLQPAVVGVE